MKMTKFLVIAFLICFALAGLTAVELDYHVGAGLALPFFNSQAVMAFPDAYGGVGVNIIPELAVGAEYEVFGLYLLGYGALVHLPKIYVKYEMNEKFTLAALGGVAFPTVFTPDESSTYTEGNVTFAGFRATAFFLYGEFLFLVNNDAPISMVSVGVAIRK